MLRLTLLAAALCSATARAGDPAECAEAVAECKEDCTMAFGTSMADGVRKKLARCLDRCAATDSDCKSRLKELNDGKLDDAAVRSGTASGPADGEPAAPAKKGDDVNAVRARREGDERLDDAQREAPKPKQLKVGELPPPSRELREDELPKSSRTEVKVEPKKTKLEPAAPASPQPPAGKPTAAPEKKAESKPRPIDEWDPNAP